MKKYFLGSVGKAEAFRNENGVLKLAFVSKTLTDSGLNISTTKDDIRGGQGAPIQFSFFHDPSVEITLTDVVFNREYITAQLGAAFSTDADTSKQVSYKTDTVKATSEGCTLSEVVLPIPFTCEDVADKYIVWGAKKGTDDYDKAILANDHKTVTGFDKSSLKVGEEYCFRYLAADSEARIAEITSMIIPEELFLVITAPIFAGDACSASKGKAAGHITFEVPRFQLNGAQEFAMNMSSNQTMSLAGIALATAADSCEDEGGKLLRIIEVLTDRETSIVSIIAGDGSAGDVPEVFCEYKDGSIGRIDNSLLTFTPDLTGGKYADNTRYTVKYGDLTDTIEIGDGILVVASVEHAEIAPENANLYKVYSQSIATGEYEKGTFTVSSIAAGYDAPTTTNITMNGGTVADSTNPGEFVVTYDGTSEYVTMSVVCPAHQD